MATPFPNYGYGPTSSHLAQDLPRISSSKIEAAASELLSTGDVISTERMELVIPSLAQPLIRLGNRTFLKNPWIRSLQVGESDFSGVMSGLYPGDEYSHHYQRYVVGIESGRNLVGRGSNGGPYMDPMFLFLRASDIEIRAADDDHRDRMVADLETHVARANVVIQRWNEEELPPAFRFELERLVKTREAQADRVAQLREQGFEPAQVDDGLGTAASPETAGLGRVFRKGRRSDNESGEGQEEMTSLRLESARLAAASSPDFLLALSEFDATQMMVASADERLDVVCSQHGFKWNGQEMCYRRSKLHYLSRAWELVPEHLGRIGKMSGGLAVISAVAVWAHGRLAPQEFAISVTRVDSSSMSSDLPRSIADVLVRSNGTSIAIGSIQFGPEEYSQVGVWELNRDGYPGFVAIDAALSDPERSVSGSAVVEFGGEHLVFGRRQLEPDQGQTVIWRRSAQSELWTSTNAVMAYSEVAAIDDATVGNGVIVAVGNERFNGAVNHRTGLPPHVWISQDGYEWEHLQLGQEFGSSELSGVTFDNTSNLFVAVGVHFNPGGDAEPGVWTSSDGRVWQPLNPRAADFSEDHSTYFNDVARSGDVWLAVGSDDDRDVTGWDGSIWWSRDLENWIRVDGNATIGSGNQGLFGVDATDQGWIVVGADRPTFAAAGTTPHKLLVLTVELK